MINKLKELQNLVQNEEDATIIYASATRIIDKLESDLDLDKYDKVDLRALLKTLAELQGHKDQTTLDLVEEHSETVNNMLDKLTDEERELLLIETMERAVENS